MRILLLGGTSEARRLGELLADRSDLSTLLSYAGRTTIPADQPVAFRVGGFGGVAGLRAFLRGGRIDAAVDATHPFAERMSAHAVTACRAEGVPLARLARPAWVRGEGDRWRCVADFASAAAALGEAPRRVLLTIGQGGLEAFSARPQHFYLVRSIGAPESLTLPNAALLLDRPPYTLEAEAALMEGHRIEMLVTKNSGGAATVAKLHAARSLGIAVVMIERPILTAGVPEFDDPAALLAWIDRVQAERGV